MVQASKRFTGRFGAALRMTFGLSLAVSLLLVLGADRAGAVVNPDYTAPAPTTVLVAPTPAAPPATQPRPLRTRLPITGADLVVLALAGTTLVGVGVTVRTARLRRSV